MNIQNQLKKGLYMALAALLMTSCGLSSKTKASDELSQQEIINMELENNKQVVRDFIEAMRTSDTEKLKTMITDDFSWWIIGKPEYLATAGEHDTEYFLGFFKGEELFPEGTDFKITSMIAEGNRVAAEAEFRARTAMGTDYENYYHFLFIIDNGKVKRMKEYMDTYNAKVTFGL